MVIDEAWWEDYCIRIFGGEIRPLNTNIAANLYGQLNLDAKDVLFVTETYNPYSDLTITTPSAQQPDINVVNFDCDDCNYGIDVLVNYD